MNRTTVITICLLVMIATSCGPMNKHVSSGPDGSDSIQNSPTTPGTEKVAPEGTTASKNSCFFVQVNTSPGSVALGDNTFKIRIFSATDQQIVSNSARVNLTYNMPAMPEMGASSETPQRQSDGDYQVTLFFSMPGEWEVTLNIEDSGVSDAYVLRLSI
jgi:hypothetical protein